MNVDHSPADYEIIVVDNGSTDATPAVVQDAQERKPKYNINYIREERLGLRQGHESDDHCGGSGEDVHRERAAECEVAPVHGWTIRTP